MLSKHFSVGLLALAVVALIGCSKQASAPTPACYSGTVVGSDCGNGYLVQVDAQFPIGAPLRMPVADSLPVRPNIIAAVNRLGSLGVRGQRIYFTYTDDPNQQRPDWPCTTDKTWPNFPVPHLVLNNLSTTPCEVDVKE